MVPHHFEINVALNGQHFFATHERSITDLDKLKRALDIFKAKFPKSEGYDISATAKYEYGEEVKV